MTSSTQHLEANTSAMAHFKKPTEPTGLVSPSTLQAIPWQTLDDKTKTAVLTIIAHDRLSVVVDYNDERSGELRSYNGELYEVEPAKPNRMIDYDIDRHFDPRAKLSIPSSEASGLGLTCESIPIEHILSVRPMKD